MVKLCSIGTPVVGAAMVCTSLSSGVCARAGAGASALAASSAAASARRSLELARLVGTLAPSRRVAAIERRPCLAAALETHRARERDLEIGARLVALTCPELGHPQA